MAVSGLRVALEESAGYALRRYSVERFDGVPRLVLTNRFIRLRCWRGCQSRIKRRVMGPHSAEARGAT